MWSGHGVCVCAVCVLRVRMCACVRVCFMCVLALRRPSFDTVLVYRVGHVLCSKHLFTYMYHIHFFSTSAIFSVPAAGHSLRCRARRGPACALGASLGPGRAPWRGLWAFLQSRSIWQVMTRSLSDPPSQARPWKPPVMFLFPLSCCICYKYHTSPQMCTLRRSHGTTAATLQAFPFVTTMK